MGTKKHRSADVLTQDRPPVTTVGEKITKLLSVAAFRLAAAGLEKAPAPPPHPEKDSRG